MLNEVKAKNHALEKGQRDTLMTQYQKIRKRINYLERIDLESPTGIESARWCSDQITWAYKWKKITKAEMDELCERMIDIFGGNK